MNSSVWLIDDDADDRLMFCEAIGNLPGEHRCFTAGNGNVALEMIGDETTGLPDLIFLDINMPMIDGWQCLSAIKNNPRYDGIPVIIYSTSSLPEDISKGLRSGATCFFTKPYRFTELQKELGLVFKLLEEGRLSDISDVSTAFVCRLPGI